MTGEDEPGAGPRLIPGGAVEIAGPEDITIDHAAGVAFVASQQRAAPAGGRRAGPEKPGGAVHALDLSTTPPARRLLVDQTGLGRPFHARGCTFVADGEGRRRFMVINARAAGDQVVEIFDVTGGSFASLALGHVRTVADRARLVSPNDLVALDGERFFVANDHGTRGGAGRFFENLLKRPVARVVFWDGSRARAVGPGLVFGNGIALDRARGRLIVAETRARRLRVLEMDPGDPARLTEAARIALPGCPDNLEWDEDGALWIGAHPSMLRLTLLYAGWRRTAPSQVLRVRFDRAGPAEVDEVWRDESGEVISASSVAAVHGTGARRRLLIGQPFGSFVRDCELRGG